MFATPDEAIKAPQEQYLYVACLHEGTGVDKPDFLAVVGTEPDTPEYGKIILRAADARRRRRAAPLRLEPLRSACHGPDRTHLIVPGFRSSRIHIVNVADDPRRPTIEKVIEPEEVVAKTGYTRPHTVHCMPGDKVVISMLGNADGSDGGGFARSMHARSRWSGAGEPTAATSGSIYDFWYQPRHNVMISSEFGIPSYEPGFNLDEAWVPASTRRNLHFWNLEERRVEQSIDLGGEGLIPLEVRFLHDPAAAQGYVGAALRRRGAGTAERQLAGRQGDPGRGHRAGGLAVPGAGADHRPGPVDGRSLPVLLELAARDLRQYDISDPANPKLVSQLWLGGVLGKPNDAGRT